MDVSTLAKNTFPALAFAEVASTHLVASPSGVVPNVSAAGDQVTIALLYEKLKVDAVLAAAFTALSIPFDVPSSALAAAKAAASAILCNSTFLLYDRLRSRANPNIAIMITITNAVMMAMAPYSDLFLRQPWGRPDLEERSECVAFFVPTGASSRRS
jgi:hypothetical protein